ncbi:DUF4156 domain-containing protein [Ruegeria meonggei]|uniref:DUF4156 domain-containing protein n=1 Tax=Ruegeria meonggei TaxID=1446476 RepID=UPI00366C235B
MIRTTMFLISTTALLGCSTELVPGAERVRQISPGMTSSCTFIGPVTGAESMGMDVAGDVESAYNKVRNAAFDRGGNAFVVSSTSSSSDITVVQADIYACR